MELAIAGAEASLEQIDDFGGDVMPVIMELAVVHLEASRQTRPDPAKLAERLFRFQTEGVWDTFYDVLPAYAGPLGDAGLHRYRELVGNSWNAFRRRTACAAPHATRFSDAVAGQPGELGRAVRRLCGPGTFSRRGIRGARNRRARSPAWTCRFLGTPEAVGAIGRLLRLRRRVRLPREGPPTSWAIRLCLSGCNANNATSGLRRRFARSAPQRLRPRIDPDKSPDRCVVYRLLVVVEEIQ